MNEPTTNFDPIATEKIENLIYELKKEYYDSNRHSLTIVELDMRVDEIEDLLVKICARLIFVKEGRHVWMK